MCVPSLNEIHESVPSQTDFPTKYQLPGPYSFQEI